MSKPVVVVPDAERIVADFLDIAMTCGVGVDLPANWTPASAAFLQVASDGTPAGYWPVWARTTIRLTAWAASTTLAKATCAEAEARMLAHPCTGGINKVSRGTGPLPGNDPATKGDFATATVLVRMRLTPLA